MSDYDYDRRSDSQHSDGEDGALYYGNGERHINDCGTLLMGADVERGGGRAQFHASTIPNELGDEELVSFDSQNDVMIFVGANGKVIIRDTKTDDNPITAIVSAAHKGFVSPDGLHAFVSAHDGSLHYFSVKHRKATVSQKVNKDTGSRLAMVVESVCWNAGVYDTPATTGNVLLGSKAGGLIFAACVDVTTGPTAATFAHCRHVLQLPESDSSPIHGLKVVHNASIHSTAVLATTTTRLYPFIGRDRRVKGGAGRRTRFVPLGEEAVLQLYKNGKQCEILDMGLKSNITKGALSIVNPKPGQPLSYAWLSSAGITHGLFRKEIDVASGGGDPVTNNDSNDDDDDNDYADYDDDGYGGANLAEIDESAEVADQFESQCHIPIGQRGVGSMGLAMMSNANANGSNNGGINMLQQQQRDFGGGGGGGFRSGGGNANNNNQQQQHHMPETAPIEMVASAFHMFVLYENRIVAINHPAGLPWRPAAGSGELTGADVSTRVRFDPYEHRSTRPLVGIVRDEATRKVYYYSKLSAFELTVENEHAGQWRLFLTEAIAGLNTGSDAEGAAAKQQAQHQHGGAAGMEKMRIRMFEAALRGHNEYWRPTCSGGCTGNSTSAHVTKGKASYSLKGEEAFQRELMTNGPFIVLVQIYTDFPTYKSGVYVHTYGKPMGLTSFRLVGWGVLDGVKYWKIANSWNENWGMGGFFLMERGTDALYVESFGSAGVPF